MTPRRLNFAERVMLQHAYIPKLVLDCAGAAFAAQRLWIHDLAVAALSLFGSSTIGSLLAANQDLNALALTPLGKWMLGQARPLNLLVRTFGAIVLSIGIWQHLSILIALGFGTIIIARLASDSIALRGGR